MKRVLKIGFAFCIALMLFSNISNAFSIGDTAKNVGQFYLDSTKAVTKSFSNDVKKVITFYSPLLTNTRDVYLGIGEKTLSGADNILGAMTKTGNVLTESYVEGTKNVSKNIAGVSGGVIGAWDYVIDKISEPLVPIFYQEPSIASPTRNIKIKEDSREEENSINNENSDTNANTNSVSGSRSSGIVERVIQRVAEIPASLFEKINQLQNDVNILKGQSGDYKVYTRRQQDNIYDKVASSVVTSGSLSGTFSGSAELSSLVLGSTSGVILSDSGTISASSTLPVSYGGTGTTTAPTYGKVLLGNTLGGYDLVATSTLGITSGVSSQWTTSGSNIYYDSGNVGVGTSSPYAKLSVAGQIVGSYFNATSSSASVFPYASTTALSVSGTSYMPGSGIWDSIGNVGVGTTTPFANLAVNPTAGTASNQFVVGSSTATNFVITNEGKVGIGTLSPTRFLEIGFTGASTASHGAIRLNSSADDQGIYFANAGTDRYSIRQNGSILTFTGAGSGIARGYLFTGGVADATVPTAFSIAHTWNSGVTELTGLKINITDTASAATSALMDLQVSGSSKFFVRKDGNTGIASSTPFANLAVNPTAGTASNQFVVGSSTATNFIVTNSGNVGIGTASPSVLLDVSGGAAMIGTSLTVNQGNNSTNPSFLVKRTASFDSGTSATVAMQIYGRTGQTADLLQIGQTSGSGYLVVTGAGNVGIGTTTPYTKLSVVGEVVASKFSATTTATSTFGGPIQFSTYSSTPQLASPDGITGVHFDSAGQISFHTNGTQRALFDSSGNFGMGSTTPFANLAINPTAGSASNQFVVGSSTATNFIIDNSGKIAIGTASTTPAHVTINMGGTVPAGLEADGMNIGLVVSDTSAGNSYAGISIISSSVGAGVQFIDFGNTSDVNEGRIEYNPYTDKFNMYTAGSTNPSFSFKAGQFGYTDGGSVPAYALGIGSAGQGSFKAIAMRSAAYGTWDQLLEWDVTASSPSTALGTLRFANIENGASSTPPLTMLGSRVGISTTTPFARLAVDNFINSTYMQNQFLIASGTPGGASTTQFIVKASGNIGIGTSTPAFPLDVYNTISSSQTYGYLNSSGSVGTSAGANLYSIRAEGRVLASEFNAVSDARLKDVQFNLDSALALDVITKLQPVSFTWKNNPTGQPVLGLLAQDVEQIIPNAVSKISTGNFEDQRELSYNQIVAVMIGAVKELKIKLDSVLTWFTDGKLFVQNDVCVDDVCVTKEEFKTMLLNAKGSAVVVPENTSSANGATDTVIDNGSSTTTSNSGSINSGSTTTDTSSTTSSNTGEGTNTESVVDNSTGTQTDTTTASDTNSSGGESEASTNTAEPAPSE